MFFEGTLQEGLAAAVQQSKLVISFVTDEQEESQQWQEYLKDDAIAGSLGDKGILLKLPAGSQEAGYLAALYPLPKTPTLVIMTNNGQLKDYIAAGASKTDFLARVARALGASPAAAIPAPAAAAAAAAASGQSEAAVSHSVPTPAVDNSAAAGTSSSSDDAQLAERAARLAAQRKRDADEAKEAARRRKEKGKAKADPADSDGTEGPSAGKPKADARKAAQQLRQRQQEAALERQRILKQIEHNRAERKARDEQRKAERLAAEAEAKEDDDEATPREEPWVPASLKRHEFCSLQVRLFDGSNIRTRLPSGKNIRDDVRRWVDETRDDGRAPYTFRVIFPNRLIEETDEDKSLAELGLTPSSTLVLLPVEKYATAYDEGDAGLLQRLVALVRHFIHMVITFFTTIFRSPTGTENAAPAGQAARQPLRQRGTAADAVQERSRRIKGVRNGADAQRDYQLYNGNSLNFEPRPDEEDEETP